MFKLVYIKNQFNRPDTLLPFLQTNTGKTTPLQIDCISPYHGTELDLARDVCEYMNGIDPQLEVAYMSTQNISVDTIDNEKVISFIVLQISVTQKL